MALLSFRSGWSWFALLSLTGVHSWWNTAVNATRTWSTHWAPTPLASNFPLKISSYQPNINKPPHFPVSAKFPEASEGETCTHIKLFAHSTSPFFLSVLFQPYPPPLLALLEGSFRWKAQTTPYDFVFWIIIRSHSDSGGLSRTFWYTDPSWTFFSEAI